jgi:hypothetical protein
MRSFIGAESHATWRARFSNSPRPEVEEALTIRTRCIVKQSSAAALAPTDAPFYGQNSSSVSLKVQN